MECKFCGKPIDEKDEFCPHCGAKNTTMTNNDFFIDNGNDFKDSQGNFTGYNNGNAGNWNDGTMKKEDKADTLVNIASCCFPIVGVILFFIWREEKPKAAKSVCIWASVGFGIGILLYIVGFVLSMFGAFLGDSFYQ